MAETDRKSPIPMWVARPMGMALAVWLLFFFVRLTGSFYEVFFAEELPETAQWFWLTLETAAAPEMLARIFALAVLVMSGLTLLTGCFLPTLLKEVDGVDSENANAQLAYLFCGCGLMLILTIIAGGCLAGAAISSQSMATAIGSAIIVGGLILLQFVIIALIGLFIGFYMNPKMTFRRKER